MKKVIWNEEGNEKTVDEPIYKHDCAICVFLTALNYLDEETFKIVKRDLYFCKAHKEVVSRFGNDEGDYISWSARNFGNTPLTPNRDLIFAQLFAVKKGLLNPEEIKLNFFDLNYNQDIEDELDTKSFKEIDKEFKELFSVK